MSRVITGLFQEVFGRPYSPTNQDDRVMIQKNTYLLEKLGLELGDFWFLWDTFGPYSLELRNAVSDEVTKENEPIQYSDFAKEQINSIKCIIQLGQSIAQNPRDWLEVVCSLHYLKNYIIAEGDVISELERRKPHFSNRSVTSKALDIVNTIDTMGCYNDSCYES